MRPSRDRLTFICQLSRFPGDRLQSPASRLSLRRSATRLRSANQRAAPPGARLLKGATPSRAPHRCCWQDPGHRWLPVVGNGGRESKHITEDVIAFLEGLKKNSHSYYWMKMLWTLPKPPHTHFLLHCWGPLFRSSCFRKRCFPN